MSDQTPYSAGYDTPEIVLRVWAAERVPGLWNAELTGPVISESFYDLTTWQVDYLAKQNGARVERAG